MTDPKVYASEPQDAWCPGALMKLASPVCSGPIVALDLAVDRAIVEIELVNASGEMAATALARYEFLRQYAKPRWKFF